MRSRWLTGNGARTLSRRPRHHEFSSAFTRNVVEYLGNDPDTYYIIGADYRIPEPSEEDRTRCVNTMREAGFSEESVSAAMATLGVPPGGHHPPNEAARGKRHAPKR